MKFLTNALEAQLHREVYVALLNSLLKQPGSKREVARRAEITPIYLSYILKLDRDPYQTPVMRTPSPAVAERIVQAISAPPEIKESLLWHMVLAREKRVQANRLVKMEVLDCPVIEVVDDLKQILNQATFASVPALAKRQYQIARDMTSVVLRQISPKVNPLAFVELCSILHDTQCVLNRPDDALWHAKLAHLIMDSLNPSHYHKERERFDYLAIDAVRAEAIAYYNLKHYREAINLCEQASTTEAMRQNPSFWKARVLYDKIKALAKLPRFSITEIEYLADEARTTCEHNPIEDSAVLLLLISEALARAYIRHENYKDAKRILQPELDCIDEIPHVGPLHRVLFLKTFAQLHGEEGDREGWKYFLDEAYRLSVEAGLEHQLMQIKAELDKHKVDYNTYSPKY